MAVFDKLKYIAARILNRRPSAIKNSKIHPKAAIGNGAQFVNSSIGKYSYLYGSSVVNTKIGAFCSIAAGSIIGGGKHPTDWVSTSPVFYKGRNVLRCNFSNASFPEFAETTIGNDVWIGSKCLIKGGVTIGDGAIIGMGSVVTHDVPPYEIWAGNPAKLIRKRFPDEIARKISESKWWEWDDSKIELISQRFDSPEEFIEAMQKEGTDK